MSVQNWDTQDFGKNGNFYRTGVPEYVTVIPGQQESTLIDVTDFGQRTNGALRCAGCGLELQNQTV